MLNQLNPLAMEFTPQIHRLKQFLLRENEVSVIQFALDHLEEHLTYLLKEDKEFAQEMLEQLKSAKEKINA